MNWQLLIGGLLLLTILIAVISLVSVNVKNHVEDAEAVEEVIPDVDVAATAPPTPTAVPTPSPTPAPTVTSVSIYYNGAVKTDFMERAGTQVQLTAQWYPQTISADEVTVVWASSDESVATVDDTGLVTIVSTTQGAQCVITATVGGAAPAECQVWSGGG
jgi:hypothetical protein